MDLEVRGVRIRIIHLAYINSNVDNGLNHAGKSGGVKEMAGTFKICHLEVIKKWIRQGGGKAGEQSTITKRSMCVKEEELILLRVQNEEGECWI